MRHPFLAALPGAALLSCGLFAPGARILVLVPEPPPHWRQAFPGLRFAVEYVDARGRTAEVLAEPAAGVWVECAKEQNAPVLAWPLATGGPESRGDLRPAGGFYPCSLGEGAQAASLPVTWEDGCAALVVQAVRDTGGDTAQFNAARLAARMREAADPWSWDRGRIAEAVAAGSFTSYDLDRLPSRDAAACAGPGEWFLESPFASPRAAGPDGTLALPGVTLGMHLLCSLRGTTRMIWIGESEVIVGPERFRGDVSAETRVTGGPPCAGSRARAPPRVPGG